MINLFIYLFWNENKQCLVLKKKGRILKKKTKKGKKADLDCRPARIQAK